MQDTSWSSWISSVQFSNLSRVWLFVTTWTAARQVSLSITNSPSLLKLMSVELVIPSNHLILCHPLLLLPQSFPVSESFPSSQFFTSGGRSIGALASSWIERLKPTNYRYYKKRWTRPKHFSASLHLDMVSYFDKLVNRRLQCGKWDEDIIIITHNCASPLVIIGQILSILKYVACSITLS